MAPTRRLSNGRSPLVNQQSQITAFFSKASSSPSPSPVLSKQDPKPKPSPSPSPRPSPSPSPATPSPVQTKLKKPLLVIGPSKTTSPSTPVTGSRSYGEEVVNRRIKVYWPLDKSWYEGCVKSFDEQTGKHLVQYDDAVEETLDLVNEKIEWVENEGRSFRRLRRGSVFEKAAVQVEEANVEEESGGDDDSTDEDWGKGKGKEEVEDDSEDMEFEEEEDEEEEVDGPKKGQSKKVVPKKRKARGEGKMGSGKRRKSSGEVEKNTFKESSVEPMKNADSE